MCAIFATLFNLSYAQSLIDLEADALLNPIDGCVLSAHENIGVRISNSGAVDVDTVHLYYRVDSGTVVSQTFYDTIPAGGSFDFTFTTSSYDFSTPGSYYVEFWLSNPADTLLGNDSSAVSVNLEGDLPLTVAMTTSNYGNEVSYTIENANDSIVFESQGSLASYTTYSDNICLFTCQTYTFNMKDSYGDGWNGGTYSITTPNPTDSLPDVEVSAGGLTGGFNESADFSVCYNADAGVTALAQPSSGCILSGSESLAVEVSNFGGDTLFTWTVSYSLNNGAAVTETVNDTLAPSGSHTYTFSATEDLSNDGSYTIEAWVNIANDVQPTNDSLSTSIDLAGTVPLSISTNSGSFGGEVSWEIVDHNNNTILTSVAYSSNSTYTDNFCISECEQYTINMYDSWGDGWNGGSYTITTMDTIADTVSTGTISDGDYGSENFNICVGTDISISSILIEDGCTRSDTENVEVVVSNLASDTIFGFQLSYVIDTLAVVLETSSDTIPPGESINYTFNTSIDLSTINIYNISAWATTANDVNTSNDTLNEVIDIFGDFLLTLTTNTAVYANEMSWLIMDFNSDTILTSPAFASNSVYTDNICITTCEYYTINMYDSYGDGWNGSTYSIDFPNPNSDTLPDINVATGDLVDGDFGSDQFIYCDGIDGGLINSSLHTNGCLESDSSFISVDFKNFGADTLFTVDVSYIFNGAATVTETINDTIEPYAEYNHTFSTPEDLSVTGDYSFSAWSSIAGDLISDNDSIVDTVRLYGDLPIVISTYIQYYWTDATWAMVDINNDTIITSGNFSNNYTTYLSDEICINSCENYNFEMTIGQWYDGWETESYNILSPTGVDSIPFDTLQSGALESGTSGFDVFSYCDGFDASISDIPLSSTCTAFDEHLTVEVENIGTDTIFTIDVNYSIDSSVVVTETINDTILPSEIYSYTFSAVEDFSAQGLYEVSAWVSSAYDLNSYNDSATTVFDLYGDFIVDINLFSGSYASEISWMLIDIDSDTLFTSPDYGANNTNYTSGFCIKECESYTVNMYDSYGDGWNGGNITIISNEIDTSLSDTLFYSTIASGSFNTGVFFYCESPDVGITQLNLQSGCIYSNEQEVVIDLENLSSLVNIQNLILNYSLDGTSYTDSVSIEILTGDVSSYTLENTLDLSSNGNYDFEINVILSGDYNPSNDTIELVFDLNSNSIPNLQSFDALSDSIIDNFDNGAWIGNADTIVEYAWTTQIGSTPSYPYTGPSSGNGGSGTYLYVEQDNGNPGDIAIITSRCYNLTTAINPKLGFWYHKSGADQGNLLVRAISSDTTIILGNISGQTQLPGNNPWLFQQYDLDAFIGSSLVLEFEAQKTSTGSNGDIGLDDINIIDVPQFFIADAVGCSVDSIMITGPDDWSTYVWSSTDSMQTFTNTSQSAYVHSDADITLITYDTLGFHENYTFNVIFQDSLGISSNLMDTTICIGNTLVIGDTIDNADSYIWSSGDSVITINVSPQQDSIFVLTASNMCYTENVNYNVYVSNPLVSILPNDTAICEGDTITLSSSGTFSEYQWNSNASEISTEQTVAVNTSGYYALLVTNEFGCQASSQTAQITYLSEEDVLCKEVGIAEAVLGDITIYPNPNKGLFSVEISPLMDIDNVTLQITNPVGEVVYENVINKLSNEMKSDIDLSHMAQGIYIVTIRSNSLVETRKLTLQR